VWRFAVLAAVVAGTAAALAVAVPRATAVPVAAQPQLRGAAPRALQDATTTSSPTTTTSTSASTTSTTVPPGVPSGATAVEFFEPWVGNGLDRTLRVSGTVSGSCFVGSLSVDDPHAWRCLAGDRLLDPCFAPPAESRPRELACGSPWSSLTLLRLEQPLPRATADRASQPSVGWLLQLAGGVRCQISQGAAGRLDGVAIAYVCSHGGAAGALDWSEEPWSVPYLSPSRHSPERKDVTVAWGG